eukprot:gnl/Trimastix_PCT/3588.p1 GENE.gnl/Trimastix_PCT/3588~~gnl/Trimastix_PCT/3588.p1  ORF type:complete len:291 (+),score=27.12 gnl/Trimastix_PCT/3588:44-874(+)
MPSPCVLISFFREHLYIYTLLISLLCCLTGFYQFHRFFELSYFLIMFVLSITVPLLTGPHSWTIRAICSSLLILLWDYSLGFYVLFGRKVSIKQRNYPFKVLFGFWICLAPTYLAIFSPALLSYMYPAHGDRVWTSITFYLGIAMTLAGIYMERLADRQKGIFRNTHPSTAYCNTGLYRFTRHPNYFGECLVWLGIFILGIPCYGSFFQWALAVSCPIVMFLIMLRATLVLEKDQYARYHTTPGYAEYIRSVPVLVPFFPLYCVSVVEAGWVERIR